MSVLPFALGFGLLTASTLPLPPPPGSPASIHTNEAHAVRMLRQIAEAERTFRDSGVLNTNCDRIGEYGFFAELAGTQPMRVCEQCQPAAGRPDDVLASPLLPSAFGQLQGPPNAHGFLVPYKGYYFQIWLAGPTVAGLVGGIREDTLGGKAAPPYPDPVNGARYWICYSWPIDHGVTGVRAFCISQREFVLACENGGSAPFDGYFGVPWFDEALEGIGDLGSPLRVGIPGGAWSTIWELVL